MLLTAWFFSPSVCLSSSSRYKAQIDEGLGETNNNEKKSSPLELINRGHLEKGINLIKGKPAAESALYIAHYTQAEPTSWGYWMSAERYLNIDLEKATFHAYKGTFLAHVEFEFRGGGRADRKNILGTFGRIFQPTIVSIRQQVDEHTRNTAIKTAFRETINLPPPKNKKTIFWSCYLSGAFNEYGMDDYKWLDKRIERMNDDQLRQRWRRAKQNLIRDFDQLSDGRQNTSNTSKC